MRPNIENPIEEKNWKDLIVNTTSYDDSFPTRKAALVAAHDLYAQIEAEKSYVVEYGVIELT
jgi:hypothetical protein